MSDVLPLYPGAKPCQRSGYCCEQGPCPFGTWDPVAHRCTELFYEGTVAHCRQFAAITALPQRVWWLAPAFGVGCCSPMNPKRKIAAARP